MQHPLDSPNQGQRMQLVAFKGKGISDPAVIAALEFVPRHWFMDAGLVVHAYKNSYPIAEQTISHPYTVAFQSELIDVKPGAKVLEIGTGSGYQTAILKAMKVDIYTIERQRELFKKTQRLFDQIGLRPKQYFGRRLFRSSRSGTIRCGFGYCWCSFCAQSLVSQIKVGGRLVIHRHDPQIMHCFTRTGENLHGNPLGSFACPHVKG